MPVGMGHCLSALENSRAQVAPLVLLQRFHTKLQRVSELAFIHAAADGLLNETDCLNQSAPGKGDRFELHVLGRTNGTTNHAVMWSTT